MQEPTTAASRLFSATPTQAATANPSVRHPSRGGTHGIPAGDSAEQRFSRDLQQASTRLSQESEPARVMKQVPESARKPVVGEGDEAALDTATPIQPVRAASAREELKQAVAAPVALDLVTAPLDADTVEDHAVSGRIRVTGAERSMALPSAPGMDEAVRAPANAVTDATSPAEAPLVSTGVDHDSLQVVAANEAGPVIKRPASQPDNEGEQSIESVAEVQPGATRNTAAGSADVPGDILAGRSVTGAVDGQSADPSASRASPVINRQPGNGARPHPAPSVDSPASENLLPAGAPARVSSAAGKGDESQPASSLDTHLESRLTARATSPDARTGSEHRPGTGGGIAKVGERLVSAQRSADVPQNRTATAQAATAGGQGATLPPELASVATPAAAEKVLATATDATTLPDAQRHNGNREADRIANEVASRAALQAADRTEAAARESLEQDAEQQTRHRMRVQSAAALSESEARQSGDTAKAIQDRMMSSSVLEPNSLRVVDPHSLRPASETLMASPGGQLLPVASPVATSLAALFSGEGGSSTSAPHNVSLLGAQPQQALAENVRWMVNQNLGSAQIHLTPAGMGPVSIKLDLDQDALNVSIVAPHGVTREALESLLPRLREQLQSQGHQQVDVTVSDRREAADSGQRFQQHEDAGHGQGHADAEAKEHGNAAAGPDLAGDSHPGAGTTPSGSTSRYDLYV